jgi:transporter family-2 protein
MHLTAYAVTAMIGALLALQVGLNAMMRSYVGSAVIAALINFLVGSVALAAAAFATRAAWPSAMQLGGIPWWVWLAGLGGAAYVAASAVVGPLIGGAAFVALVVTGQMICSMTLDHFGVLGFPERSIDLPRIAGAVLMVVGVILLTRR